MNKKEINDLKKEFKVGTKLLSVQELYSVYLKKDNIGTENSVILHEGFEYFEEMEEEKQELYLDNFKKMLGGTLDAKLFQLEFEAVGDENPIQQKLTEGIKSEEKLQIIAKGIVHKIIDEYVYESDVVVNFIKGEYWRGFKDRKSKKDESIEDMIRPLTFIMATINKIEMPKKALQFDFQQKAFRTNSALNYTINLAAPLEGFMFPVFTAGSEDIKKVLYYTGKSKETDTPFVKEILNCGIQLTGEDEKNCFTDILKSVVGEKIKPELMQEIYANLYEMTQSEEENEIPRVGMEDVKNILEGCGIQEPDKLETAFTETCGVNYGFKIENVIPDFQSKSIQIQNESANIRIAPKELNTLRQIKDKDGKTCLLIELSEDVVVEGFKLETEEYDWVEKEQEQQ